MIYGLQGGRENPTRASFTSYLHGVSTYTANGLLSSGQSDPGRLRDRPAPAVRVPDQAGGHQVRDGQQRAAALRQPDPQLQPAAVTVGLAAAELPHTQDRDHLRWPEVVPVG